MGEPPETFLEAELLEGLAAALVVERIVGVEPVADRIDVERPELAELDAARALLGQRRKLAALAHKPVLSAFASGGIGRPFTK